MGYLSKKLKLLINLLILKRNYCKVKKENYCKVKKKNCFNTSPLNGKVADTSCYIYFSRGGDPIFQ